VHNLNFLLPVSRMPGYEAGFKFFVALFLYDYSFKTQVTVIKNFLNKMFTVDMTTVVEGRLQLDTKA
jgi:hypothetical protein